MISSFKVSAPASIGNFIVGFDHIGAAINWPSDEIYVKPTLAHNEIRITKIMGDKRKLSKAIDQNIVGIAITSYIKSMEEPPPFGLDLQIKKCIGIGTGLGSSASSATAAVMAINEALKRPLEKRDLLIHANKAEAFASGSIHADNTAPALFGGIQLVLKDNPHKAHQLTCPKGLYFVMSYPHISVNTVDARKALSAQIKLSDHATQNANTAAVVLALERSDFPLLRRSLQDTIIAPQRAHLIPYYDLIKDIHADYDAITSSISGAGPTMVGIYDNSNHAENAAVAIKKMYKDRKLRNTIKVCQVDLLGTIKC